MTISGEVAPEAHTTPAAPTIPDGMVMVRQAEHDAAQGDLRRTRKELAARKQADEDRERKERADAAAAAGDFDKALGEERGLRKKAEQRANKALLGDAITDVLLSRAYTGEQASAIRRMADRDSVELDADGEPIKSTVVAAVDAVVSQFPNLFSTEAPEVPATRGPRRAGPATPPPEQRGGKPDGYVSPEEYAETPHKIRYSDAFRARVAASEPHWPEFIHRGDLQQDVS